MYLYIKKKYTFWISELDNWWIISTSHRTNDLGEFKFEQWFRNTSDTHPEIILKNYFDVIEKEYNVLKNFRIIK